MKKEKIKEIIKKVLFILFVVITCGCWCISISRCYHNKNLDHEIILTHELNKARVNDDTYTTFNIGYNNDYQENYITGVYEFEDTNGQPYSYVYRLYDFYAVVRDDGSTNDGNIYGIGFTYSYELFSCNTDTYFNHSIEDYGTSNFYADYNEITPIPLNRAYNLYNSNLNLNFTRTDEMIYLNWTITLNTGQVYLASTNAKLFFDMSEYVQFVDILTEWKMSLSLPITQLYYSFNYGNNYQQGYDAGITQGKDYVIDNPSDYGLKTYDEYLQYGESKYNEGYNQNANYSLESEGFLIMFNTIMNAPYNIFYGMLNFEIFGINLFNLLTFVLSIVLISFVVKLFV